MAYIHCGRGCNFSQDDFWSFRIGVRWFNYEKKFSPRLSSGHNPLYCLIGFIPRYIKPRWIGFDKWFVDDIQSGHNISFRTREREELYDPNESKIYNGNESEETRYKPRMVNRFEVHSWSMLKWEFYRAWLKFSKMKWWTYKSFQRDIEKKCPECGSKLSTANID